MNLAIDSYAGTKITTKYSMDNPENIIYGNLSGTAIIWGLVLLVVFIYTIIKLRRQARNAEDAGKKSSKDVLKARYERGEISRREYEAKKNEKK